jgi:hypothetical protein
VAPPVNISQDSGVDRATYPEQIAASVPLTQPIVVRRANMLERVVAISRTPPVPISTPAIAASYSTPVHVSVQRYRVTTMPMAATREVYNVRSRTTRSSTVLPSTTVGCSLQSSRPVRVNRVIRRVLVSHPRQFAGFCNRR